MNRVQVLPPPRSRALLQQKKQNIDKASSSKAPHITSNLRRPARLIPSTFHTNLPISVSTHSPSPFPVPLLYSRLCFHHKKISITRVPTSILVPLPRPWTVMSTPIVSRLWLWHRGSRFQKKGEYLWCSSRKCLGSRIGKVV